MLRLFQQYLEWLPKHQPAACTKAPKSAPCKACAPQRTLGSVCWRLIRSGGNPVLRASAALFSMTWWTDHAQPMILTNLQAQ